MAATLFENLSDVTKDVRYVYTALGSWSGLSIEQIEAINRSIFSMLAEALKMPPDDKNKVRYVCALHGLVLKTAKLVHESKKLSIEEEIKKGPVIDAEVAGGKFSHYTPQQRIEALRSMVVSSEDYKMVSQSSYEQRRQIADAEVSLAIMEGNELHGVGPSHSGESHGVDNGGGFAKTTSSSISGLGDFASNKKRNRCRKTRSKRTKAKYHHGGNAA